MRHSVGLRGEVVLKEHLLMLFLWEGVDRSFGYKSGPFFLAVVIHLFLAMLICVSDVLRDVLF